METHYAPAERRQGDMLHQDIVYIEENPVISVLLKFASGVLAILNEERQILALNTTFLKFLGIEDPENVLGLRPGEALDCVHAHEMEAGCGTSEYCSSCGAAIAMVSSLETKEPIEKICMMTVEKRGKKKELLFKIRSQPFAIENRTYLMLFLTDITGEQQAAIMERIFFHDINNIVFSILGSSELLCKNPDYNNVLIQEINSASIRLAKEIAIQRTILQEGLHNYQAIVSQVALIDIVDEVKSLFVGHQIAENKELDLPDIDAAMFICTDQALVVRILVNMIKNALEATEDSGKVKLAVERTSQSISFVVWNDSYILPNIQKRIFQRNFSTKEEIGRGLGTYSMKYFGEEILGGSVDFRSSSSEGTRFWLTLSLGE